MTGIYKITNPKGKIYIGSSKNIPKRWKEYYSLRCENQPKLYRSLKKYGLENHKFEIVWICDEEYLYFFERLMGEHFKTIDKGLNCSLPGYGSKPMIMSEETIQKLREQRIGKKHTSETLKKMSKSLSGVKNGFYGKKHSEESKKKMSPNKGKPMLESTKRKISETLKKRNKK